MGEALGMVETKGLVAMIEAAGYRPDVVEYRKAGWTASQLRALFAAMGSSPREVMREKGTPAAELGLLEPGVSDERLIEAMIEHPILVNRPIVQTPKGTKLCRPSEEVLSLLDRQPTGFTKEDGQAVEAKQIR